MERTVHYLLVRAGPPGFGEFGDLTFGGLYANVSVMKLKILRECEMPEERLLHPGEGCDCSVKFPRWFYEGEIIEDYQIPKVDLSGLTYRVDYDIIEYP